MASAEQMENLKKSWEAFGAGEMDTLAGFYVEDMVFIFPGQSDVLAGRGAFRAALDGIGQALPPGFEVTDLRYYPGENEIMNVLEFRADKLPEGSATRLLFRFNSDNLVTEERWFIDTEQWKAAL